MTTPLRQTADSIIYVYSRALHSFLSSANCHAASIVTLRCTRLPLHHPSNLTSVYLVMQSKKNTFFKIKNLFLKKKTLSKKTSFFMVFYYYLQFKGRKVFFNTLECFFMLYTSCKTLHSVCQLHFH